MANDFGFVPINNNVSDNYGFVPLAQQNIAAPDNNYDFVPLEKPEFGFFDKISESFRRGNKDVLARIGIYQALKNPDEDLQGALNTHKKLRLNEALNPIEGNFLSNLVYKSAETTGQMIESIKRAGVAGAVGAGAGAIGGATVGLVLPSAGEEPSLIGAGARLGFKIGATEAAALFSYQEGVGGMYADMVEQGSDPKIANTVAHIAGIPYALLELLQLKTLTPNLKKGAEEVIQKGVMKVVGKFAKKYAGNLTEEVVQEMAQEVTQIVAEDTSSYLSKNGVKIDKGYIEDRIKRVLSVAKEATQGFALLPIPGAAMETSFSVANADFNANLDSAKAIADAKIRITPEDLNSPIGKFTAAIQNSIDTYESQEQIRKKERGRRFAAGEEAINNNEGNWRQHFKRELKGEYSKLGIEPLQETIPVEFYESLDQELRITDKIKRIDAVNLGDAVEKLYKEGEILRPYEIKLARKVWGDNFANTLEQLSDTVNEKGMSLADYLALPKVTSASMDISRTLRQNVLLIGKPKLWAKGLINDIRLFASNEKTARTLENNLYVELTNNGDLINKTGLRINKWGQNVGYKEGSERFGSKLAKLVPGIRRSEQAYSAGGNMVRMQYLKEIAENRKGITTTDKEWSDIGHVLNIITGEGDPKTFGRYAPTLNAIFFAPRLLQARIRAFTDLLNPNLSWAARKILAYHVTSFIAANMALLAMMSAVPGVEVETDYRSTDFGKIKIGKQRIDFWGGYLPLVRFVMRMVDPTIKTQSGRIIEGERSDTIWSFLQSKLGPAPAFVLDLMRGQTFYGDYVGLDADSLSQQFYQRFTPLFIQDIIDALHYQGLYAGMRAAPLSFFGAGIQTYPTSKTTEVLQKKNMLSMQALGQKWDDLGPEVQKYMRGQFPEIEQAERQAKYDRSNFSFLEKIGLEREKSVKRMTDALPSDVRDELELLNLKPAGTTKVIASDWYLNESRYRVYETKVTLAYKEILTKMIRSPKWNQVPPPIKVKLLTEVMNEIKQAVRTDVIATANKEDILRLKRQ